MIENIYNELNNIFKDSDIKLVDFSSEHHGHGSHVKKGSHLKIYIKSKKFEGKTRVNRQKMVNHILKPFFEKGLHAVELYLEI